MTIKNLDREKVIENKEEQIKALQAAFESADPKEVAEKIITHFENNALHFQDMMNTTIREANRAKEQQWDDAVLAQRGVRALTTKEKEFYNKAIEVKSFDGVSELVPPTVYERVFEDLAVDHPLLSKINFQRVGASTMWVVRKEGATTAFWGDVCENIKEMVDHGFRTFDQGMYKLSGFLVVCKAMFEIGPEWLDRYVRAFLTEIVAAELESVVVIGDGNKKPIGMIRDLDGAVQNGVYPEKDAIVLNDLSPKTIGREILAPTTVVDKDESGHPKRFRRYKGVTFILNPYDYAYHFFGQTTKQRDDGVWMFNNFPVPELEIVQSTSVPLGKMIVGHPKDYFMGVASEAKLESTDVLRMIEDQRLYLVRQLANGRPLDNDSFRVFDISKIGEDEETP
ncbi:phage major capsid protein [Halalkalibacterium halodurans]|uniref:phage major capsid protein n=1 Tax=Halalkalibacterium halodurans TaxID=86665 RepID=UPI002E1FD682|nr:phage major capsid protein [Halalkalibacterium halodurans]MED4124147.1 phage major capsid protein [Halalkalibacterium halodurans]